jgi:hypothetical protein
LFALAACDAQVQLVQPRASTAAPAILTVVATDTALARRAGWSPGIPGATVFLRLDADPTVRQFTTDGAGQLSLPDLRPADYWIWAEKRPSGMELEVPEPQVLGGGRRVGVGPGSGESLPVRGQQDGSLVISEFYYHSAPMSLFGEGVNYHFHWYLELYNNSDTTIYLDGKIVGAGFNYGINADLWPCTETEPFRNDPRGIWSQKFQAFPGTGRDHPLAPRTAVVIAEQAIDHGTVYPGLPDLSQADFQFYWETRAMNPAVPTMLPIQLSTGVVQTMFLVGFEVPFVAEPVDVASLERMRGRYQGDFVLFPKEAILDAAVLYTTNVLTWLPTSGGLCRRMVHESLDALGAFVRPSSVYQEDSTHLLSAQRKVLPDGHLQRTGTSAADWEIRVRSPGRIP